MSVFTFSCYAWREGGVWEAICVDLDIAVQGISFDDVYHRLNDAVVDYVETVSDLPEEDRARLLKRRAPLSARAGIHARRWRARLRRLFHNDNGGHGSFPVDAALA